MSNHQQEEAVPIALGVKWDRGAPMPYFFYSEHRAFLVFFLDAPDPSWDGTSVSVVSPSSPRPEAIGIIEWQRCNNAILGGLNDEVIEAHRLWGKGLSRVPYGAAEVRNSAWIAEMLEANSIHPFHNPENAKGLKHYILLFHDSTFECTAFGYRVEEVFKPLREVLLEMVQRLLD